MKNDILKTVKYSGETLQNRLKKAKLGAVIAKLKNQTSCFVKHR